MTVELAFGREIKKARKALQKSQETLRSMLKSIALMSV